MIMDISKLQDDATPELMAKPNVCGTASGFKWKEGKPTDEPAILVFVQNKVSEASFISKHSIDELIPSNIDGIPTDVIEVGDLKKQGFTQKVRPLVPGYSCGHGGITAGTMGGFFLDRQKEIVMLSNNHVVGNENRASINDLIYQPGPADSRSLNPIGRLKNYLRLNNADNPHDSGIVAIDPELFRQNMINDMYPGVRLPLKGFRDASINMPVQKFGRTTGHTTGTVLGLNGRFKITFDMGVLEFVNCIVTSAMSKGGDSGSIIMDMDMHAIGLLFAGSDRVTLANPIQPIVDYYGLGILNLETTTPTSWQNVVSSGSISHQNNAYVFQERANNYCFIRRSVSPNIGSISCKINTGTDQGATWGPGLTLSFPDGAITINLRYNGSFGGYFRNQQFLGVGQVQPNTDYELRIINNGQSWVCEIKDQNRWHNVLTVPRNNLNGSPSMVSIGKIGPNGVARNHSEAGPLGLFTCTDIRVS